MTYVFDVIEKSYGVVSVEADSEIEAREKAHDEYDAGNIDWGDSDVEIELGYTEEVKE